MVAVPVQTPIWLDMSAVVVAALGGALIAVREDFDLTGILGLGLISGLGGGLLRDILLNQLPVALKSPWYIVAAVSVSLLVALLAAQAARLTLLLLVLDAAALGLYGVTGINKALANGLGVAPGILIGLVAAIGGGALRDVATARPPAVFVHGESLYATASLAGLITYAIGWKIGVDPMPMAITATLITFGLRLVAWRRNWILPRAIDAPSRIRRGKPDGGPAPDG